MRNYYEIDYDFPFWMKVKPFLVLFDGMAGILDQELHFYLVWIYIPLTWDGQILPLGPQDWLHIFSSICHRYYQMHLIQNHSHHYHIDYDQHSFSAVTTSRNHIFSD